MGTVKLYKTKDGYQTKPLCGNIGRFWVIKTDNANARAIGRRPKWTIIDLYGNVNKRFYCDTLAEVKEQIERHIGFKSLIK